MENKAAPRMSAAHGLRVVSIAALAGVLTMLVCFAGSAPAAKGRSFVARDGKIHACYKVKGKPKGMVRVVRGKRHRCRRGERRMSWLVAAAPGQAGVNGQDGEASAPGTATTATKDTTLETKIAGLTLQVETLEGQLQGLIGQMNVLDGLLSGVEPGDLSGVLATLSGLSNEELTDAVNAVSMVESLCAQNPVLAEQVNLLQDVIGGLGLNGILTGLGGLLEVPVLPTALELSEFGCTAP